MGKKYFRDDISLDKLVLDKENPRFADLYSGSNKESDIIDYLLFTESANEIAEAIFEANEFYDDRPLWVYKEKNKYIVKDGNRRCSAVKALQFPTKYGLDVGKFEIKTLPVLVYNDLADLEKRIRVEHNSSLFKKWGRIAKAIEIYRLFSSGSSLESLTDIDSSPRDLIKIATFYNEASKIKGEEFKKLVREGRGKIGGKTIVFERLFKVRTQCGYNFKRITSEIIIKDEKLFSSYIKAIVQYLKDHTNTTSRSIDATTPELFLLELKPYGFPPEQIAENSPTLSNDDDDDDESQDAQNGTGSSTNSDGGANQNQGQSGTPNNNGQSGNNGAVHGNTTNSGSNTRGSTKTKPSLKRKKIPAPLRTLIDECYKLDENNFANSKTALTRVTFECTLKYVVEKTKQKNGKPISTSNHFQFAFKDRKGVKLPYTNFSVLKTKFAELIKDTGTRKAFEVLDLEIPHQIIHNYNVIAIPKQAKDLCNNLIALLDFMLLDEEDLINSLDMTKL